MPKTLRASGSGVMIMRSYTRHLPWLDRAGRLSTLKLVAFMATVLPGLWIALELREGWLQPKPITEAIHQSGTWAVRFLLLSLAITPFRRVGQWGKLIAVRRMLGLAVLAYAIIHLALYAVDQHLDLVHVASEIALRFYLTIGFVALIGFAVLGATSTDGMIRRIGGKRWQQLHRIVYGLGALALLHFMLQAKLDISQPVLMSGLFLILMGWRALQSRGLGDSVAALIGVAVLAGTGTALIEACWYHAFNRLPIADVIAANLSFDNGPSAAGWVVVCGLGVAVLRIGRLAWNRWGHVLPTVAGWRDAGPRSTRPRGRSLACNSGRSGPNTRRRLDGAPSC